MYLIASGFDSHSRKLNIQYFRILVPVPGVPPLKKKSKNVWKVGDRSVLMETDCLNTAVKVVYCEAYSKKG